MKRIGLLALAVVSLATSVSTIRDALTIITRCLDRNKKLP